tara:strand:- start:218 stop:427 length:210 start_codon:yes stop_codon:yes gene_type:complete
MEAKEKAKELVDRFNYKNKHYLSSDAIECALICVDEKQKTIDKMFNGYYTMPKEWQKEYDELEQLKKLI